MRKVRLKKPLDKLEGKRLNRTVKLQRNGIPMPVDLIPEQMIEEILENVGNKLDEKYGKKDWVKRGYWFLVIVFLSVPLVYFFW
jgi:hypothetical protein